MYLRLLYSKNSILNRLFSYYPVEMVDFMEDLIRERSASVHGMLRVWGLLCCKMEIPKWQVENINTQEAYQELLAIDSQK